MEVDTTLKHTTPMTMGPNIPIQMMMQCIVVYDATNKVMIKNRFGEAQLNDALVLKMWLGEELPVFEWKGYKEFHNRNTLYHQSLAA